MHVVTSLYLKHYATIYTFPLRLIRISVLFNLHYQQNNIVSFRYGINQNDGNLNIRQSNIGFKFCHNCRKFGPCYESIISAPVLESLSNFNGYKSKSFMAELEVTE